jgi:hypothetical protein
MRLGENAAFEITLSSCGQNEVYLTPEITLVVVVVSKPRLCYMNLCYKYFLLDIFCAKTVYNIDTILLIQHE